MTKVLVVDDEGSIASAVAYALRREGYAVETASDGEQALERVETFDPDVMVLDVMMPRQNGYEVCRRLAERQRPAILLLTVKNDIVDKVLGLELGADDYMTKPFDIRELLARVKALARRSGTETSPPAAFDPEVLQLAGLTVEMFSRTARIGDQTLDLTPKEFDLLALLARNPERVYSREALLSQVWEMDFAGGTRTVDIHVQRLRKKLGDLQGFIQTVYGIGYKSTGKF
ncbi:MULTISPECIES: response regulator transcription factor [unclassified Paenibacillus]|uniref:response regulator transcription factor n=1 Tax=unclassified Paenibacillus TaxID=185978 RepID=UPI0009554066|nr:MULTISPECIES: response regulator transcription factor [unclassified Paenibacillus]ASS67886.1 response regulator transcription factor [Paenibacillus sp. RUD330]SIR44940.1 DNA-binding response regulator, OmpR family, contains REC and winged-helix (wHTH) domain [Paenibacillus sp. RU4X]SIR54576.1 DNA-binding response regulator, OmpR family, contains REC and winged-helix (wHTH) domain [Paenibacillus sp. RU4T]